MSGHQKIVYLKDEAHAVLEAQPKGKQSEYANDAIIEKETVDSLFKGDFANVMQNIRVLKAKYGKDAILMDAIKAERIVRSKTIPLKDYHELTKDGNDGYNRIQNI